MLHMGVAIANIICAYDPSMIVLQGKPLAAMERELRRVVAKAIPWTGQGTKGRDRCCSHPVM